MMLPPAPYAAESAINLTTKKIIPDSRRVKSKGSARASGVQRAGVRAPLHAEHRRVSAAQ